MVDIISKNSILPVVMGDCFVDLSLTDITAQIILKILIRIVGLMLRIMLNPTFHALIMDILDRSRAYA